MQCARIGLRTTARLIVEILNFHAVYMRVDSKVCYLVAIINSNNTQIVGFTMIRINSNFSVNTWRYFFCIRAMRVFGKYFDSWFFIINNRYFYINIFCAVIGKRNANFTRFFIACL